MTSLFCSASTTASCTHFIAVSKSTISPLRTPRDGAWPTPRILSVPSGRLSPTTTQILEVPISRPTIRLLFAIFIRLSFVRYNWLWKRSGSGARFRCRGSRLVYAGILVNLVFRRMHWDRLHDPRLDGGFQCVVDYSR